MKKLFVLLLLMATGCDGGRTYEPVRVELYSSGKLVHEWTTVGKTSSPPGGDKLFFTDASTGREVTLTGDWVVTRIE
jgi:hypothetical protein